MVRVAAALALVILFWLVPPAGAEPLRLSPGEVAPESGVFFAGDDLTKLVEALRDRETWKMQIETFRAQVQALEDTLAASRSENAELRTALDAQKLALAKAEWLDQNWQRLQAQMESIITKYEVYATKLEQRLESVERQRNLAMLGGPILGLIFLLLGML